MKKFLSLAICVTALTGFSVNASAQDLLAELAEGCGPEIEQFCSNVTLGDGRLAACFYAFEDKLSNTCNYTLYEVSSQLQAAAIVLDYFIESCGDDIVKLCGDVEVGEGRVLNCLSTQSTALGESCSTAIVTITE